MTDSSDAMKTFAWEPPAVDLDTLKTGDMPGDKIQIQQSHIDKANTIFPHLWAQLGTRPDERWVVSVYGGSGVGKSEIASLLGHYCAVAGFGAYVLSGDNYARRVPTYNDQERLWAYRTGALNAFALDAGFTDEAMRSIHSMWPHMADMHPAAEGEPPWMAVYRQGGLEALTAYLGTEHEIDFSMVNTIIGAFKSGQDTIPLKRMGQTTEDLRYEGVDFAGVRVLIVEWTHGNNALLEGVDFPIFLFSTPQQTLAHRLSRGRDTNTDSPLIGRVLDIEHATLMSQVDRAALIISKDAEVLTQGELADGTSHTEGRQP